MSHASLLGFRFRNSSGSSILLSSSSLSAGGRAAAFRSGMEQYLRGYVFPRTGVRIWSSGSSLCLYYFAILSNFLTVG